MAITKHDVAHVADLARLALTDEETELYTVQLQRILSHVEKLSEIHAGGAEPDATAGDGSAMREDRAISVLPEGSALKGAPSHGHGCFKVPQIID